VKDIVANANARVDDPVATIAFVIAGGVSMVLSRMSLV
jgi:hypothetical protein